MSTSIDQERRRSGRQQVEIPIVLLLNSESRPKGVLCQSTTVDCSEEGARIYASVNDLQPGSVLVLAAGNDSEEVVPGRVVWVRPLDRSGTREVGVRFLHGSHLRYRV